MVEYLISVCMNHKKPDSSHIVTIVALGTAAHNIATIVSARLRANGISCTATLDSQPARLSRLTYGSYSCLCATTFGVFRKAADEWSRGTQGAAEFMETLLSMSSSEINKLNTVFVRTISSLIEHPSNHMHSAPNIPTHPNDVTHE